MLDVILARSNGSVFGLKILGTLLTPLIPLALAVGSIMAALGAAVALLPLSMAILTAIMIQSDLELFAAVVLASVTAFAIRIALTRALTTREMQQSAATTKS